VRQKVFGCMYYQGRGGAPIKKTTDSQVYNVDGMVRITSQYSCQVILVIYEYRKWVNTKKIQSGHKRMEVLFQVYNQRKLGRTASHP
jgi:hypothetical protein